MTSDHNLEAILRNLLDAFEERDLERCMVSLTDDAQIAWLDRTYNGSAEIKQWLDERFSAGLRIVDVNRLTTEDESATLDFVAASDRLRKMGLQTIKARAKVNFQGDKVSKAKFGLRFP